MILSGWTIYNASPLFAFSFPRWAGAGGWLGSAIAWHLAAAWLLLGNGLLYALYGLATGHFRRRLWPAGFGWRTTAGQYKPVQKLAYLAALGLGVLLVASGLALWKPVQLQGLAALFGGYEAARRVHFLAMAGVAAFTVGHVAMVAAVPSTLLPMLRGR